MRSAAVRLTVVLAMLSSLACSHFQDIAQPDQNDIAQQLRDSHVNRR